MLIKDNFEKNAVEKQEKMFTISL